VKRPSKDISIKISLVIDRGRAKEELAKGGGNLLNLIEQEMIGLLYEVNKIVLSKIKKEKP
jgi:hypothetical protein